MLEGGRSAAGLAAAEGERPWLPQGDAVVSYMGVTRQVAVASILQWNLWNCDGICG